MPLSTNLPTDKVVGGPDHVAGHNATNTRVNEVATEVNAHEADTTAVHGIADTSVLATTSSVSSAVSTHAAATDPHGDRAYTDAAAAAAATLSALRHADRARAEVRGLLAETLPGATISDHRDWADSDITGGTDETFLSAADTLDPRFRVTGALPGDPHVDGQPMLTGYIELSGRFGIPLTVEFAYDGSIVEFTAKWQVSGQKYRVWADGILIGTAAGPTGSPDGAWYRYTLTLPDARRRVVRIDGTSNARLVQVRRQASTSITYPSAKLKGPRVIVFGDSYVEGAGATNGLSALPARLSLCMDWIDVWQVGAGGTGYDTANVGLGLTKFTDRTTEITSNSPDIVIVAGGINDYFSTASAVGTAAGDLYDDIRTALPDVELVVVGPWTPKAASAWDAQQIAIRDAIKAEADERGLLFLDPAAEQWITGVGDVGAPTGTGNADVYISADAVHPTDAGHAFLAERIAGHLKALGS